MSKQILFVCAGKEFPQGAFNFLCSLQAQEPVHVLGLFFNPIDVDAMVAVSQIVVQGPYDRLKEEEHEAMEAAKESFARQCEQHHIRYQVHVHDGQWDKDILVGESRFADVLVLSGELFYADINLRQPNVYLREALSGAECPVVIIPEVYKQCDHVFMAYDGTKESLFAIKQFCYLFPWLTDLPTEMLYVRDEPEDNIPDLERLRQYTRQHFDAMGFSKLHFKASHYFSTWIGEKKNVLLVTGSYGRSAFSYLAKHSFAEQVISEHKIPVFIAHA
jgi:hypothetical protein